MRTSYPLIPGEFWEARPLHAHIRQAAHSRLASADTVFHAVLAKVAGMVSHELRFDSGRGLASLNHFVATVGPSGIGKSVAAGVVDHDLVPVPGYLLSPLDDTDAEPFIDGLPLGSGEGLAEAFMGMREVEVDQKPNGDPILRKVRGQVRHNVFVSVDEGEMLVRLGERQGSTVATTLRSAWIGATIGQANGREDTTRVIKAGTYSLGLLVGFQPSTALPLISETAAGTAQRFAWVSAVDRNLPDVAVEHPGPISLALADADFANTARTGTITFPTQIVADLRAQHIAKVRGDLTVDERDSHAPLMRCKLAALLALLDDRTDVTTDDWQLAGILWDTSAGVRDAVAEQGHQEYAERAERVAQARVDLAERTAAATNGVEAKVERLAQVLAEKVLAEDGMTRGYARRTLAGRDRHLFDQVVERAHHLGTLRASDSGLLPPEVTHDHTP